MTLDAAFNVALWAKDLTVLAASVSLVSSSNMLAQTAKQHGKYIWYALEQQKTPLMKILLKKIYTV